MSSDPPCTGDPELFFSEAEEAVALAKKHCSVCPVRDPCLELAMGAEGTARKRYGVFGALSGKERARLQRRTARLQQRLKEKQDEQRVQDGT